MNLSFWILLLKSVSIAHLAKRVERVFHCRMLTRIFQPEEGDKVRSNRPKCSILRLKIERSNGAVEVKHQISSYTRQSVFCIHSTVFVRRACLTCCLYRASPNQKKDRFCCWSCIQVKYEIMKRLIMCKYTFST